MPKKTEMLEIPTRVVEISVNRLCTVLQNELKLTAVEALFILDQTCLHIEKTTGLKIESVDLVARKPKEEF